MSWLYSVVHCLHRLSLRVLVLPVCLGALVGCTGGEPPKEAAGVPAGQSGGAAQGEAAPMISNRIEVPESVRENLGITFARVERRAVARTLRVPGQFEAQPFARREYHSAIPGQVELLVRQYQTITTGTPLYRLNSAEWRRMQQTLAEAETQVRTTSAALAATLFSRGESAAAAELARRRLETDDRYDESLREAMKLAQARVDDLEKTQKLVGPLRIELAQARAQLAQAKSEVAKSEEERVELEQRYFQLRTDSSGPFATSASLEMAVASRKSEYEAAKLQLKLARSGARAMLRIDRDGDLDQPVPDPANGRMLPLWQTIETLEIKALAPGVVQTLDVAPGTFVESGGLVMTTVDPAAIRFRGTALQSDLASLANVSGARILSPEGRGAAASSSIPGNLSLAVEAHPEQRTIDVVVDLDTTAAGGELPVWARPGVSAQAEITVAGGDEPELAIPVASVVQDDLAKIFFRRDPKDPDKVIRVHADLGVSDGKWVVVNSGVIEGDEIALEGVYELKLTGSGKAPQGGHFHADGTWHAGND